MSLPDEILRLDQIAEVMNQLWAASSSDPRYDIMSDGLFWDDELPPRSQRKPARVFQMLRFVFRYRTSLILGVPDKRFEEVWDYASSLFPGWVGFNPSRCQCDVDLAEVYKTLKYASERKSGISSD